jgi:hypothetical protein
MKFTEKEIQLVKEMEDIFRRLDEGQCVSPFFSGESLNLYREWMKTKAHKPHPVPKSA